MYAKEFYKKASNGQLKSNEIGISSVHPYHFANIKTQYLTSALSLLQRESLIITDISTQTKSFSLGTTDLVVVICFDSQLDDNGNKINGIMIPYSLRVEEIRNKNFNNIYEVDFVLSKSTHEKEYTYLEYGDKSKLSNYIKENNLDNYKIDIKNLNIEEINNYLEIGRAHV